MAGVEYISCWYFSLGTLSLLVGDYILGAIALLLRCSALEISLILDCVLYPWYWLEYFSLNLLNLAGGISA